MGHRQLEVKVWLGLAPFYDTLGGFSRILYDIINLQRIYSQHMTEEMTNRHPSVLSFYFCFFLPL